MTNNNIIKEAMKLAKNHQESGEHEAIWDLLMYLKSTLETDEPLLSLLDLSHYFQYITKGNPHYHDAVKAPYELYKQKFPADHDLIQEAMKLAEKHQQLGEYEPIWDLLMHLKSTLDPENTDEPLLSLYDLFYYFLDVTENNPHHQDAMRNAFNIYIDFPPDLKASALEKREFKEDLFKLALKINDSHYIAGLYNDLCGFGLTRVFENINLDDPIETLLYLARKLYKQNKGKLKEAGDSSVETASAAEAKSSLFHFDKRDEHDDQGPSTSSGLSKDV